MSTFVRNVGGILLVVALVIGSTTTNGRGQDAGVLQSLGLLGAASDFNVFVFNNMTAANTDATGKIAVGGTAIFNNYSVANGQHDPIDFGGDNAIFGGNLVLDGNLNMNSGSVVLAGTQSGPGTINFNSPQGYPPGTLQTGSPIDFVQAKTDLQNTANSIANLTPSADARAELTNGDNELVISSNTSGVLVVDVPISYLQNPNRQVRFDVPPDATVVLNVQGAGAVEWPQWAYFLPSGMTGSQILWNMPDVTEMTSSYAGIQGTILAPNATFNFNGGQVEGQIIVDNLYGSGGATVPGMTGQSHYFPFEPSEPVLTPTPCPTVTPTGAPTEQPTEAPTAPATPTVAPTEVPTESPTEEPT